MKDIVEAIRKDGERGPGSRAFQMGPAHLIRHLGLQGLG